MTKRPGVGDLRLRTLHLRDVVFGQHPRAIGCNASVEVHPGEGDDICGGRTDEAGGAERTWQPPHGS